MKTHKTTRKTIFAVIKMNLVMLGIMLFFAGAAQTGNQDDDFKSCDVNKDKKISKTEFSDRFSEDVKKDKDLMPGSNNGTYDEESFYRSSYQNLDRNRDEKLDKNEWEDGLRPYGHYVAEDYEGYDYNNDGYLSYEEYQKSLGNTDYFKDWDKNRDSSIDSNEYSEKVFDKYDKNKDDYLDESEFNDYHSMYNSN